MTALQDVEIQEAVILAAGMGTRMYGNGAGSHKALSRLMGIPIIERGLLALRDAGIRRVIIVTGHAGEALRLALGDGSRHGLALEYVESLEWPKGNGASLHDARTAIKGPRFVVAMADHWFEPAVATAFLRAALTEEGSLLLTDYRIDRVADFDDATKVSIRSDGMITGLGKGLAGANAVDCGLFVFTPEIFSSLEEIFEEGEYSLGAASALLASRDRLRAVDIGEGGWEDVDTKPALVRARRKLASSLKGRDDGFIARQLNRRLSVPISLLAIRLHLSPNAVSIIAFLTAIASGSLFGLGHPLVGGLLAQVASVLDGSDGEVARARFMATKWGGLLDSVLDRVSDAAILAGVGVYLLQSDPQWYEVAAVLTTAGVVSMSMMLKDRFQIATGRQWRVREHDGPARFLLASRDGRLFALFIGGVSGQLLAAVLFIAAGSLALLAWRVVKMQRQLRARATLLRQSAEGPA